MTIANLLPDRLSPPLPLAKLADPSTPVICVVIDTEEAFDWGRSHDRSQTDVSSMAAIGLVQEVFDDLGDCPCYVVDYPVASQPDGFGLLKTFLEDGRCVVGAHLHPWVNPPHHEEVCAYNSFPGNLDGELEHAKLEVLTQTIESAFDVRPEIYKAGRYGLGPRTGNILSKLGYSLDLSPSPGFDYSGEGGPDFFDYSNHPFWFGPGENLLSIPCTGGFVGFLGSAAGPVYRWVSGPLGRRFRAPGVLARLRAVERARLSPEGFTLAEMTRLTKGLSRAGVQVFTLSFHSPSVVPGNTPYVLDDRELDDFIHRIRSYLEFFLGELGGKSLNPLQIRDRLSNLRLQGRETNLSRGV